MSGTDYLLQELAVESIYFDMCICFATFWGYGERGK